MEGSPGGPQSTSAHGLTQYSYLEDLGMKLGGQARRVLYSFLDKWDHTNEDNPDYEDAITGEASRDVWRAFCERKVIFDLRHIQVAPRGKAPTRPDAPEDLVDELAELYEFHIIMRDIF